MVELDTELARLWGTHRGEIDARLATIETAVARLNEGTLDDESRAAARRAAHQLAGTAGTFGFAAGSEHAAALETRLAGAQAPTEAPALAELLVVLRAALRGPES
jgi:chemotaxis protein histidine kinase CheA